MYSNTARGQAIGATGQMRTLHTIETHRAMIARHITETMRHAVFERLDGGEVDAAYPRIDVGGRSVASMRVSSEIDVPLPSGEDSVLVDQRLAILGPAFDVERLSLDGARHQEPPQDVRPRSRCSGRSPPQVVAQ